MKSVCARHECSNEFKWSPSQKRKYCSLRCAYIAHSLSGNYNWKGGRRKGKHGYMELKMPDHPRSNPATGYVPEHIVIAERALGRQLIACHPVHHVDENKSNSVNGNLVICQDQAYHALLHARTRVVRAGGNPNTEAICTLCRKVKNLSEFGKGGGSIHGLKYRCKICERLYSTEWHAKRRPPLPERSHLLPEVIPGQRRCQFDIPDSRYGCRRIGRYALGASRYCETHYDLSWALLNLIGDSITTGAEQ